MKAGATDTIDYSTDRVFEFVRSHVPQLERSENMRAMGLVRGGEIIAGVVFEGFNGVNLWMHAALRDGHALTRYFVAMVLAYPFKVCQAARLSAQVAASNARCLRAARHLGFQEEARLSGAAQDGGDLLMLVLRRQGCRYYV